MKYHLIFNKIALGGYGLQIRTMGLVIHKTAMKNKPIDLVEAENERYLERYNDRDKGLNNGYVF